VVQSASSGLGAGLVIGIPYSLAGFLGLAGMIYVTP
jgi:hypothetical protein